MLSFYHDVKSVADVYLVYIAEAHAADEWPIQSSRCTPDGMAINLEQPKFLDDRVAIAKRFGVEYNLSDLPLLVDDPQACPSAGRPESDPFEKRFAAWPLRFYIFSNGVVDWIAQPDEGTFSIPLLREALAASCQQH